MKIVIDAFGGDNAPIEIVKGGCQAAQELGVTVVFTGDEPVIRRVMQENSCASDHVEVVHAPECITNEEDPTRAVKAKKNSSMVAGLTMLKNKEADAFISAGNTGALMTGATLIVKRIKGIRRAALAPLVVTDTGFSMLIDAGANLDCPSEYYRDFAIMGSVYMEKVAGISKPRVGLVNVGAESQKGNDKLRTAYRLLSEAGINFTGNLEARNIPQGEADVIVCDGFTGNVILKLMEGLGMVFYQNVKAIFTQNWVTKASAILAMPGLRRFKKKMDYEEYGGALLMGIDSVVVKAHGSSRARAIYSAVRQAKKACENNVNEHIKNHIHRIGDERDV